MKQLLIILALALLPAAAGADCFYSCTENPEDAVAYYLGRDGDYHPIPGPPPPPIVYGPQVYYDRGYPVPVDREPPARYDHYDRGRRRGAAGVDQQHWEHVRRYH